MTELAIIGSDIQEVVGTAIGLNVISGDRIPLWLGSLITGLDTFTFLLIHYWGKRYLEMFIFALILFMICTFFINLAFFPPTFSDLLSGFTFSCPDYAIVQLVGTLGAVIMPHNLYLHSGLVQTRSVNRHCGRHIKQANKYMLVDSSIALLISFFINAALLVTFSQGFFSDTCANIKGGPYACLPSVGDVKEAGACTTKSGRVGQCGEIGLDTAGDALRLTMQGRGTAGEKLFALGVIAAGQASTMTGTFAGQFVMEGFLDWKIPIWLRTLITRSIALGPAVAIAFYTSTRPEVNNLVNEWLNILQSVLLPFAIFPVIHFNSSSALMGDQFALKVEHQVGCWSLALVVIFVNFYLALDTVRDSSWCIWGIVFVLSIGYLWLLHLIVDRDLVVLFNRLVHRCGRRRGRDPVEETSCEAGLHALLLPPSLGAWPSSLWSSTARCSVSRLICWTTFRCA